MNPSDETARDERGRMLPGHTANPAGRPARAAHLRLLAAAQECGAQVVVLVPASLGSRPTRRPAPPTDLPPAA